MLRTLHACCRQEFHTGHATNAAAGGARLGNFVFQQTTTATRCRLKRLSNKSENLALADRIESKLLGDTSAHTGILQTYIDSLNPVLRQRFLHRVSHLEIAATESNPNPAALSSSSVGLPEQDVSPLGDVAEVAPPTTRQLKLVAINNAIPFIGFGIMDNSILIIAGDAIDTSLGVALGISTMCAAAIGNIISDLAGIMLGTVVEDFATKLNLPTPDLSAAQRQLRSVRFANQFGCAVGITIGCIIGMLPLLFIDTNKTQVRKREARLDSIFRDVVTEAGALVGASRVILYVKSNLNSTDPSAQGKYLYAKYAQGFRSQDQTHVLRPQWIPLGRGIVSRAALTGEAWKIDNVQGEPDYDPSIAYDAKTMVCVPVVDDQGQTIGVLQAINKMSKGKGNNPTGEGAGTDTPIWMSKRDGTGPAAKLSKLLPFNGQDVQVLKALASHIGVSLQRLYESEDQEEELRLRDTIRVMKEYGLSGLNANVESSLSNPKSSGRVRLFPEL